MQIKPSRSKKWIGWLVFILLLVSAIAVVVWIYFNPRPTDEDQGVVAPPAPVPVAIESNSLFFGNAYWGRYINEWSMASDQKTAYPFSRLNEFNREDYNAWVAGLECPTVAGLDLTSAEEEATLSFNCNPDYLPEAAKWFTAFTLANNHTDNQGPEGFAETREHLEENKIQYFGHYDPTVKDDACEVIAFPVTVTYSDRSKKDGAVPIAFCAFHGVFQIPPEDTVATIKEYAQYMPVIAMPHMGAEYQSEPDEIKTTAYRSMIDYGADMVLGDHPHWIQTTEAYNGHLIVYSMGNFIFDQQGDVELTRSAAIRVLMNAKDEQLSDWLEIGKTCGIFKDDCLDKIKKQALTKLPFTYQFDVIGTNDDNKIVKPATESQQESILQRLNWENTMGGLLKPYGPITE